ncbi:trypsin theta-like [Ceratitis capitata]|uniref:(Mediterranean fruit fly) hypothetical protein n=1 Tax=Ceratitis capitata TaxID=7213 RepID=A0A811UAT4_CERCA|nr:trypsin theta-like [Ceratitis capitata]CAD6996004.1 unnamed protein product [Ceratitis capitata]
MFLENISSILLAFAVLASSAQATTLTAKSYVVTVQGSDGNVICNGALINKNTVVTAATCLAFYDPDQLVVGVEGQIVKIKSHTFDSSFDFVTMENDVAVLKLAQSVKTKFLKLASKQRKTGTSAVVSGVNGTIPVSIVSTSDCASGDYSWSEDEIFTSMLCGYAKDNTTCVGRNGSPVVEGYKLVGLVSWGGCGSKSKPAVFTNIAALASWIKQNE